MPMALTASKVNVETALFNADDVAGDPPVVDGVSLGVVVDGDEPLVVDAVEGASVVGACVVVGVGSVVVVGAVTNSSRFFTSISHNVPAKPSGHVHVKPTLQILEHFPPFMHTSGRHLWQRYPVISSMSLLNVFRSPYPVSVLTISSGLP